MRLRGLAMILVVGLVGGCAGRSASPVSMVQTHDEGLSCAQLTAEVLTNEERAKQLVQEKNSSRNRNIAVGVVGGLLFWPALFALDLSDAEKVETEALRARNQYLASLRSNQDCTVPPASARPPVQANVVQPSVPAPVLAAAPAPSQPAVSVAPGPALAPSPETAAVAPVIPAYTPPVVAYVPPPAPARTPPAAAQPASDGSDFEVHTFEE